MKYLIRTLMMLVFIPAASILLIGFLLFTIITIFQYPLNFILKGEFYIDDDDTFLVWYIEHVMGNACDTWNNLIGWSEKL